MLKVCLSALALVVLHAVPTTAAPADEKSIVVIETSMGNIEVELDAAKAPVSVANFLKYVDSGFYDGLIFHRIIPGFMIQGGGFDPKLKEKSEGVRGPIKNESGNGLSNVRGTIAMARTARPDSATCQFYINVDDNSDKLDAPRYAVFGKVLSGMEVADNIVKARRGSQGGMDDVPLTPILIKSVKRKAKA